MVIDQIKHLENYALSQEDCRLITEFIDRAKAEKLPVGKYELDGERVFAMVQSYETREHSEGKMETHIQYIDLQYMMEGEETVYLNFADELSVKEDQTPAKDMIFYHIPEQSIPAYLKEEMFLLLYPWDAHMPCIHAMSGQMPVKKIVFKIRRNS